MTILTINLSLSILLMILLPLLKKRIFLRNLRGRLLALCCIAIMIRALIPLEFSFSQTIRVSRVLPPIRDMLKYPLAIGNFSVKISWFLFFLWILTALILILKKLLLYIRMQRTIRRLPDCEEEAITNIMWELYKKYPSAKHIKIVRTDLNISPLAAGIKNPVILLPTYQFSDTEYRMILEHELLHCIRHDVPVKFAADILCSVYWWNPLFYLLRRRIFELIELGNDSQLTASFSLEEKAAYMQCLLSTAKNISNGPIPFTLSFNTHEGKALDRRICLIKEFRPIKPAKERIALIALLVLLWGFTSFTLEPYALPEAVSGIVFNKDNSYIIQCGDVYEIYYLGKLYFTLESIEYLNPDIPISQKEGDD